MCPEDGSSTPGWLESKVKTRRIILEPQGLVNYKGIVGLFFFPVSLIRNKNAYFMLVTLLHFEST